MNNKPRWRQTIAVVFFSLAVFGGLGLGDNACFGQMNLTFDNFKFEMKKGQNFETEMITEEIRKYVGKPIKIRGYILPSTKSELRNFILVRDNMECCFGPGAMLYDSMVVRMKKGTTTRFTVGPVTVEGEFRVKILEGPDGKPWSVYEIRAVRVR